MSQRKALFACRAILTFFLCSTTSVLLAQGEEPPAAAPASPADAATPEKDNAAAGRPTVQAIEVRGNAKVESDAILTLLETQKGDPLDRRTIQGDIRTLFELGYFSDVRVFRQNVAGGVKLIWQVAEKPAITSITFEGLEEVEESTVNEKLETKLFTIVNEATITSDVGMIEKQYAEKGFYLASVNYTLEKKGPSEVGLTFHVVEGGKVQVGEVHILGNEYFTDLEIINGSGTPGLASKPYTRSAAFGSASLYQDDFVKRDLEYISFVYRDQGFAEVKVAKPFKMLDQDREFVRLTFEVEEGLQYNVGSIDVSGDLLFPKEELFEKMLLKEGDLFRYSRFTRDIEMLVDKYGDLGYAYADVNPKTRFDREKRLVHINYEINKGEKVYFGEMTIVGNTKTRDNVIRREFEVADSELYSGTGLTNTKANISRLGFFEEVQIIKERDEEQDNLLHLKVKVKEKPTGQLQAAIGFTPTSGSGAEGSQWFGQGRYDEKNQSGKGWRTNLTGKWNGEENYSLDAGFTNPRVNDSQWSAGTDVFYRNERQRNLADVSVEEKRVGASIFVGRKIIELIRGRITARRTLITRDAGGTFLLPRFQENGTQNSLIFSILRNDVDNYIDPTSGSEVVLRQQFTGGPLKGDHQFMESSADFTLYLPIDFTETYRTYWKLRSNISYIYPMGDQAVPFTERYRLGGFSDLRGYKYWDIGPRFSLLRAPGGARTSINKGGDKKLVFQAEYFMPLIPEAGIKALVFGDMGRVYDDDEAIAWTGFSKDVGFGFRWITPIAPFRFEWAYPIENGELGDMEIIFYIGY